jgi:hypothetical protein
VPKVKVISASSTPSYIGLLLLHGLSYKFKLEAQDSFTPVLSGIGENGKAWSPGREPAHLLK